MAKKRFLFPFAYTLAVASLTISGLSCISCVSCSEYSATGYEVPRAEFEFKSFVTPDCPQVVATLRAILGDPPYTLSQVGFDKIRDWVAGNIEYMSDEERWGEDYWQSPALTLRLGTGDCEDFSVLLCSLLRAYGVDAERVYVALGVDDGEESGHAFVIEDWNCDGQWRRIESQAPAQLSSRGSWFKRPQPHPDSQLDKYEITGAFNDLYYYAKSFPWDGDQVNRDIRFVSEGLWCLASGPESF
ncbi:MAG: transglutaminase domain-containing protein [Dehalococcoidia bacterium]